MAGREWPAWRGGSGLRDGRGWLVRRGVVCVGGGEARVGGWLWVGTC